MSDDDLIRRGDALAAVQGLEYSCNAEEDIAALPAVTVGVKPLVWREEYQKWSADSYTATATGVGCTYIIASSTDDQNHDAIVQVKKAAAQADYEARIRAALEPVAAPAQCCMCGKRDLSTEEDGGPECQMNDGRWVCSRECYGTACALLEPVAAPDPVALLRDVPRYEPDNPLDNAPSMKADPRGDWLREADVLAALIAAPDLALIQKGAADDR